MNSWGNDYGGPNQFGNMPMNQMMPNMMQPLLPPMCMMPDVGPINPAPPVGPLIGPVMPENHEKSNNDVEVTEEENTVNKSGTQELNEPLQSQQGRNQSRDNRENRFNRRDRNQERDRSRRRSPPRDRYRNEHHKNDHNDRDGGRSERSERQRRDRPSKWGKPDDKVDLVGQSGPMGMGNMQIPMPGMMPYNMMNNMMGQSQSMDIGMGNMQSNMTPNMMSGMNMMHHNMMPNMMDQNVMMINQIMPNQPIFFSIGVLLPPLPGVSMPNRREKPPGCRTVFIGGLLSGIKEDVITEIFQRFGNISDVKLHRHGVCHVRYDNPANIENTFLLSGYRFKLHEQTENEATTIFVDYALNREDQNDYDKNKMMLEATPPRIEPFTPANLSSLTERIKNDEEFVEVAPTLHGWLERGECNRKFANQFYSLIQAANSQVRRLFNDKMTLDDEFHTLRAGIKEKYAKIILQFEQVAKILTAAKHQRVSDHFSKQQRRNIEMWLKMTEEVDNIKEEFNSYFDDEENERPSKNMVSMEKYEELKQENENLNYELEGYRNEAHLAKDEAERKFEKFKAQFIAQQALQNPRQIYPPLPPPPMPTIMKPKISSKPEPPPPTPDDMMLIKSGQVTPSEAKLISVLTAFLLVHPLGATVDYMVSYVRTMMPHITQASVSQVLSKYDDIFNRKTSGFGPNIEHRWEFITFDNMKKLS